MPVQKKPFRGEKAGPSKKPRVHMANERTLLSWIRTSIGIMAFGFVIEKYVIPAGLTKIAAYKTPLTDRSSLFYWGLRQDFWPPIDF